MNYLLPRAGDGGPSRTIIIEPIEQPSRVPVREPVPERDIPEPERAPATRPEKEPVPA